ncbi:hypothetical protein [Glaciibacter psychrotolerans]|uniref:Uncharacterized protein n=1 Tax=Glaciibacter psychrotolerans TaxID=670054 RepID=A0A7Z0J7M4_9MICO|nr:hypothetical protein [Leifsonia psychrotolerans]NYJ21456.1 hypothetical protein [Leifsonia psychrotolerans]
MAKQGDAIGGVPASAVQAATSKVLMTGATSATARTGRPEYAPLNKYGECAKHLNYPAPCDACRRDALEIAAA